MAGNVIPTSQEVRYLAPPIRAFPFNPQTPRHAFADNDMSDGRSERVTTMARSLGSERRRRGDSVTSNEPCCRVLKEFSIAADAV